VIRISGVQATIGKPQELDLAPGVSELPLDVTRRGTRALAIVLLLLGGTADLGAIAVILTHLAHGLSRTGLAAVLFAVGTGLELIGAREWVRFEQWRFTPQDVTRKWLGLFGANEWTEPLSSYAGVLRRQEYHSGGKNSPSYTLYILALQHGARKDRSVTLYSSRSPEGFRARHEEYARLFALPALIETQTGVEKRRPEDLGKSVRQRVAEGSMQVTFDPSAIPPGSRLTVRVEGDTLTVRTGRNTFGLASTLGPAAFLLGGVVILVLRLWPRVRIPAALLPLAALGILIAASAFAALRLVSEELLISPKEVRKRWRHPWGTFRESAVPAGEIEEVLILAPPGEQQTAVQAITDKAVVHFGMWLPVRDKEWVRDCIIAVISK